MAVHTATVRWREWGDEFYFLSVNGDTYLEVVGIPTDTEGIEQEILDKMEGKGGTTRPMLWARRGLRQLAQGDDRSVSFSDPEN